MGGAKRPFRCAANFKRERVEWVTPSGAGLGGGSLECLMTDPRELPQQVAELIDLAKQYLRQETIEPMRRLGISVAVALSVAAVVSLGAVLGSLALDRFLTEALPDSEWWGVAAAGITSAVLLCGAVVVGKMGVGRE